MDILIGIPQQYESPEAAAEDIAPRIIAAQSSEELMRMFDAALAGATPPEDHSRVLVVALALVAKTLGGQQ